MRDTLTMRDRRILREQEATAALPSPSRSFAAAAATASNSAVFKHSQRSDMYTQHQVLSQEGSLPTLHAQVDPLRKGVDKLSSTSLSLPQGEIYAREEEAEEEARSRQLGETGGAFEFTTPRRVGQTPFRSDMGNTQSGTFSSP